MTYTHFGGSIRQLWLIMFGSVLLDDISITDVRLQGVVRNVPLRIEGIFDISSTDFKSEVLAPEMLFYLIYKYLIKICS